MPAGDLKATGECFMNAFKYMEQHPKENLILVHARVNGRGPAMGLTFAHAFVIEMVPGFEIENAIDVTKDLHNPVVVPLEYYRHLGGVHMERRYDRHTARQHALDTGTFGPWDDTLATDADRRAKGNT